MHPTPPAATGFLFLDQVHDRFDAAGSYSLYAAAGTASSLSVTRDFLDLERTIVENAPVSEGERPRILLLCPGASLMDPAYAYRLLARLADRHGPGDLIVCERDTDPVIGRFYQNLDLFPHHLEFHGGERGNLQKLQRVGAHVMLAFHPNQFWQDLKAAALRNLATGGLLLWQEDFPTVREEKDWEDVLFLLEKLFSPEFGFLAQPSATGVVRTYFSEVLMSASSTLLFQRCKT